MALPKEKRRFLLDSGMSEEAVAALERDLEGKSKELADQGIEFKEGTEPEGPETETKAEVGEEVETPEAAAEPEPEPEPAPPYVTHEELEQVFGSYVKPLVEGIGALRDQMATLGKELKELQRSDEEKVKETIKATPAASLFDRIGSVIGAPETAVDGRTSLAKSGPNQQPATAEAGPTLVPWLNDLISRQRGGG